MRQSFRYSPFFDSNRFFFFTDLAVAVGDQVQLLSADGVLVGNAIQEFDFLKALAFDSIRHRFLVSNMYEQNDTIIAVDLANETEVSPLVEDLPDDILVCLSDIL